MDFVVVCFCLVIFFSYIPGLTLSDLQCVDTEVSNHFFKMLLFFKCGIVISSLGQHGLGFS